MSFAGSTFATVADDLVKNRESIESVSGTSTVTSFPLIAFMTR